MDLAKKGLGILGGIALVTTAILPKRQTAAVIDAGRKFVSSVFSVVMGLGPVTK
jgi:hypothetical protein